MDTSKISNFLATQHKLTKDNSRVHYPTYPRSATSGLVYFVIKKTFFFIDPRCSRSSVLRNPNLKFPIQGGLISSSEC